MVGYSRGDQMGRVAATEDGLLRKTQTEERKGGSRKGVAGGARSSEGCSLKTPS